MRRRSRRRRDGARVDRRAHAPSVVFATAHDEHAIRAFDLAAVDYLLKPIAKDRLARALDRVRARKAPVARDIARAVLERLTPRVMRMAVKCGAKYTVFDVDDVVAVIADDHYATILAGDKELLSDEPLDKLMARLDSSRFLRVHRSAIVNVARVAELEHEGDRKYVAVLDDPRRTRVPIARDRLEDVKTRLGV